jgi:Domain of unknown function (DUF4174)
MKLCLFLFVCLTPPLFAGKLADYQWKKRLLVVTVGNKNIAAALMAAKAGLLERDLEVFVLSGPVEPGKAPGDAFAKEIRARLKVRRDLPEVILLGKDGSTILRWKTDRFSVDALFASIDAMPMRRREMESK